MYLVCVLCVLYEQALKHCVAEDPRKSGGIGGDNMTFMVVVFDRRPASTSPSPSASIHTVHPTVVAEPVPVVDESSVSPVAAVIVSED